MSVQEKLRLIFNYFQYYTFMKAACLDFLREHTKIKFILNERM